MKKPATSILVINDDCATADLLKQMLGQELLDVVTTTSSTNVVDLIKKHNPTLIILDLYMAGIDGWHLCKLIRGFSQAPILVLSAFNNPEIVARALDGGADDFLIKPVPTGVLIASVNKLIRRSQSETQLNYFEPDTSSVRIR